MTRTPALSFALRRGQILLVAVFCTSCARSPCRFTVQFDWTGPLTWVYSSRPHARRNLTAEETALVMQTATATLAAAFEEFPRVCVGARGKPTDVLQVRFTDTIVAPGGERSPHDWMFFGQSLACGFGSARRARSTTTCTSPQRSSSPSHENHRPGRDPASGRTRNREYRRTRVRPSPQFRGHGLRGRPVVHRWRRRRVTSTARHSAGRQTRSLTCVGGFASSS